MARTDENGVVHPTEEDPWDVRAAAHIAFCPDCSHFALPESMMPEGLQELLERLKTP